MGRSQKRKATEVTETGGKKRATPGKSQTIAGKETGRDTRSSSRASQGTFTLSTDQLDIITKTVTEAVLSQLKQKTADDTSSSAEHDRTGKSTDKEPGSPKGSETSSSAVDGQNKTESVIPINIVETTKGEGAVIMPATAASLPVPLGMHVDTGTKSKIWSNQFIDLSILLSRQTSQSYKIQLEDNQLTMTPKKKIFMLNMEQWNQAFMIYMSVYVEKYPDQAIHMLQYIGHIQEMAQMSGENAARHYDQMFRKWRQNTPLPWNVINQSLHAKALAVGLRQKIVPGKKGTGTQQRPCFSLRYKGVCNNESCPYRHFCDTCKAVHPNKTCSLRVTRDQSKILPVSKPQPKPQPPSK